MDRLISTSLYWSTEIWVFNFVRNTFVCVCGVYRPTREFFTHMETSQLPVKGCKFWPSLALMAIEQWGFFNVPHLLWHGPTLYNDHLRGPVTVTPITCTERLAVELLLPVFTSQVCRDQGYNSDLSHASRTFYLYATAAIIWNTSFVLVWIKT